MILIEEEIFKPIQGYPDYEIGSNGTVISYKGDRPRILKAYLDSQGRYYYVDLRNNGINKHHSIHRLVAQHFVDNPENFPVVNHKDHDSHNNNYTNLEWMTQKENIHHSYEVMDQYRNMRKCYLIFPNGDKKEFKSHSEIQKYRDKYNLPFGKFALFYYGKSQGYSYEDIA